MDCMYPANYREKYTDPKSLLKVRLLEPMIPQFFKNSPMYVENPMEADLFLIPHYSKMCQDVDGGRRWAMIPSSYSNHSSTMRRYSLSDHVIVNSCPYYSIHASDRSVDSESGPIIVLLDFNQALFSDPPWIIARSQLVPFLSPDIEPPPISYTKNTSVYVAMSTDGNYLRKEASRIRLTVSEKVRSIPDSKVVILVRNDPNGIFELLSASYEDMRRSKVCIVPEGDAPSSKRFFDSVNSLCVPLVVSDRIILPFEDMPIDYSSCVIQVPLRKFEQIIESISFDSTEAQRRRLVDLQRVLFWGDPENPKPGGAFWLLSWSLYNKNRMMHPYHNSEMTGWDEDPDKPFV